MRHSRCLPSTCCPVSYSNTWQSSTPYSCPGLLNRKQQLYYQTQRGTRRRGQPQTEELVVDRVPVVPAAEHLAIHQPLKGDRHARGRAQIMPCDESRRCDVLRNPSVSHCGHFRPPQSNQQSPVPDHRSNQGISGDNEWIIQFHADIIAYSEFVIYEWWIAEVNAPDLV